MQHQRKRVADGFFELSGGMDAGRSASIIERNKVAYASNVRFRGGFPKNRPGFKKLNLMFKKPDTAHLQTNKNDPLYEVTDYATQGAFEGIVATTTSGPLVVPALGASVSVSVSAVFENIKDYTSTVYILGIPFTIISATQASSPPGSGVLVVRNDVVVGVGSIITAGSAVDYKVVRNFQGAAYYKSTTGEDFIFASVGGRFFLIDTKETRSTAWGGTNTTGHRAREILLLKDESTTVNSPGYTTPAIGNSFSITVSSVANISSTYNSAVYIGGASYRISSITAPVTLTLINDSVAPGTAIPAGEVVNYKVKDVNSPSIPKVYFCHAEQFLIIQDGQSKPLIFDGANLRRAMELDANGRPEIPTGTAMAYGNGRLWIAINGKYFVAGDIVGGPSGTDQYGKNDAIFKMTENTYLNEGGFFRVPDQAGDITAMTFIAVPDTSLGQGALQVYTATHVISVNAPVDRDQWKNLQYPIQTISLKSNGSLSDRATVLVNGDTFFRSKDGLRSFQIARRETGSWGNTPLSNEISTVLDRDAQYLLKFCSAVLFDNRLIMTAEPVPTPNGAYFRCLVSLDFHPISAMSTRTPPAFDGVWNGQALSIDFLQLFTGDDNGNDRCFFFGRNSVGKTELWEITKDGRWDYAGTETAVNIPSYIETASFGFGYGLSATPSDAWQLKRLDMGEMFCDDVAGSVSFAAKYRPDQAASWTSWHSWSESVTVKDCSTPQCSASQGIANTTLTCYSPGYRARMRLPEPADTCETGQTKLTRFGYEFQGRLEWTGSARIKKFRMQATEQQEEAFGECRSS